MGHLRQRQRLDALHALRGRLVLGGQSFVLHHVSSWILRHCRSSGMYCLFTSFYRARRPVSSQRTHECRNAVVLRQECKLCDKGSYQDKPGKGSCELCEIGTYTDFNGSVSCGSCSSTGYTTAKGQTACLSCAGLAGITCVDGIAVVSKDYWAYLNPDGSVATASCLPGACAGGAASNLTCGKNRPSDKSNVLCGLCNEGFVAAASGDCVPCKQTNSALVFALILCIWIYVLVLHALSQSSSAEVKVLLYFVSASRLIIGPENSAVAWFAFWELNPGRALWNDQCVMKLTSYEQMIADVLMHFVAIGQLWLSALLYYIYCRFIRRDAARYLYFTFRPFVRTTSALMIYSFSTLTSVLFNFLQCVDVGEQRVLYRSPEVDCNSSEYASRLWLIWLLLVVWVIGLPLAVMGILFRGYRKQLLADQAFRGTWGLLYESYSHKRFFFEPLLLIRRVSVVALAVLLYSDQLARTQALSFVCFIWCLAQVLSRPFARSIVNYLETTSLALLTIVSVLLTGPDQFGDNSLFTRVIVVVLVLTFVIGLALFILFVRCRRGLKSYRSVYRQWSRSDNPTFTSLVRSFATQRSFPPDKGDGAADGSVEHPSLSLESEFTFRHRDYSRANVNDDTQLSAVMPRDQIKPLTTVPGVIRSAHTSPGEEGEDRKESTPALEYGTQARMDGANHTESGAPSRAVQNSISHSYSTTSTNWQRYENEQGVSYFFNPDTNESSWTNPLDTKDSSGSQA